MQDIVRTHREALAENFSAWVDAVEQCLLEADRHLPKQPDRRELAGFVLTAMRGGRDAGAHAPGRRLLRSRGAAITDVFGLS
jgi:hypothetical protein